MLAGYGAEGLFLVVWYLPWGDKGSGLEYESPIEEVVGIWAVN